MVQSKVVKTSLTALKLVLTVVLYGIINSVLNCLNIQFQFVMRVITCLSPTQRRECQTNESASDCDLLCQLSPMSVGVVNVFRSHAKRTRCSIWLKYIATYKGFFRMLHCFLKFAHGRLILSYVLLL